MKYILKQAVVAIAAVSLFSCATIMHGTTQKIGVSSSPTGATVSVDNKLVGSTPLFTELKRGDDHIVTIEMKGFEKTQLTLTKSVSGWVWGNIVFGGIIGLAVDAMTGGLYSLSPKQLHAELRKNSSNVSVNEDGVMIVAVLQPNPLWKKIGNLPRVSQP